MASSLESPTFRWKHDLWVTTPRPDSIDKSTVADVLDDRHQAVFQRAMTNVLATDLAELTFAQLVDGLPLWEVAIDMSRHSHTDEEPVCNHTELCPGAMEKARALRQTFNPLIMEIRSDVSFTPLGSLTPKLIPSDTQLKVLNRYQSVPVGSRASKLPLIELIAVAVHALAVQVFTEVDGGFHKHEKWPSDDYYNEDSLTWREKKPTPFLLWLTYDCPEQYPHGVADVAAYWAEDRIFGGVILFGRGKSGKEVRCFVPLPLTSLRCAL